MIEIARERVHRAEFVVGDALELPFPDPKLRPGPCKLLLLPPGGALRLRFLAEARRVANELVVVGSHREPDEPAARWENRVLADGTHWPVFKRVFEPHLLAEELDGEVLHAGRWFVVVRA